MGGAAAGVCGVSRTVSDRNSGGDTATPEDAADWRLIDDQIGQQLLEFDRIQNYRHNPTVYVELLGGGAVSAVHRCVTRRRRCG